MVVKLIQFINAYCIIFNFIIIIYSHQIWKTQDKLH